MDDAIFLSVKKQIAFFFGVSRELITLEDDIEVELPMRLTSESDTKAIRICNQDLREVVSSALWAIEKNSNSLEMTIGDSCYECALETVGNIERLGDIKDLQDNITYSVGLCSFEYCVYLIAQYAKEMMIVNQKEVMPSHRFRHPGFMRRIASISRSDIQSMDWRELLPFIMDLESIRITSADRPLKKKNAEERATSFEFKYMYCYGRSIRRYRDIREIFFAKRPKRSEGSERIFDTAPKRKYDEDVVDYFRLAVSTADPYVQYISYYHVLEFYFSKSFKRGVAELLKKSITKADFSLTESKLYDVAKKINKEMGSKEEKGYGGELNELKYVLLEHIDSIEELKEGIQYHDPSAIEYYQNEKVPFANDAPKINWRNIEKVHEQLAKRVYQTRNSLIHSKERKDSNRYRPFKDQAALLREVPLVKALAEAVIDNEGECY